MLDKEGRPFVVDAGDVKGAEAQGWRQVSDPKELEALRLKDFGESSPVLAGLAGAARGATFEASDVLLTKTGAVNPATLKALEEGSPNASLGGEVVGAILPSLVTEGAGEAGVLARVLARAKSLATAPTRALGAAAEGAAKLGAEVGLGRTGQAVIRGAVEGAAYKAGDNLSEAIIEDKPLTAQALFHDLGTAALFGGATVGAIDKAVGAIAEHVAPALGKAESALNRLGDKAELGEEVLAKELPKATAAVDEALAHAQEKIPERWEQLLEHAPASPQAAKELLDRAVTAPEGPAREALLEASRVAHDAPDLLSQHEIAVGLARSPVPEVRAVGLELATSPAFGEAGQHAATTRQALQGLAEARAALEAATPEARASAALAWRDSAVSALQTLHETTLRHTGGQTVNVGRAIEAATKLGGEVIDHPSPLAHALESLGHGGILGAMGLGHSLGVPLHALGVAAPAVSLGMGLASVARGGQSATVAKLARRGADVARTIRETVDAVVASRGGRAPAVAVSAAPRKPFETSGASTMRRIAEVRALAADPAALASRIAEASPLLHQHAPQVAAQMVAASTRAAQYLASVAPKDPRPPSPMPQRTYVPSDTERQRYEAAERAVTQPLSVLNDLRRYTVTPATVQALKTTHPDLYGRMCSELRDSLTRQTQPLPVALQTQVDLFLGVPVSPVSQTARSIAATPPPKEQAPAPAPGPSRPIPSTAGARAGLSTASLDKSL